MARLIAAFIFITLSSSCQQIFFYLTAMTSEPTEQTIYMPQSKPTTIPGKNDITILLYNDNNIYAYTGSNINSGKKYNYNSISSFLKQRKTATANQLSVIIKPGAGGTYKNTVDILDQMAINDIKKYTMGDPTETEKNLIKQLK